MLRRIPSLFSNDAGIYSDDVVLWHGVAVCHASHCLVLIVLCFLNFFDCCVGLLCVCVVLPFGVINNDDRMINTIMYKSVNVSPRAANLPLVNKQY